MKKERKPVTCDCKCHQTWKYTGVAYCSACKCSAYKPLIDSNKRKLAEEGRA